MSPEDSRRKFEAALADLRAAFAEWAAAKEEQIEQLLDLGWSGKHEDIPRFLEHLEQQTKRLYAEAEQTRNNVTSTAGAAESVEVEERLQAMKVLWAKDPLRNNIYNISLLVDNAVYGNEPLS